ncbi:MAG: hypothetical protein HC792_05810 [Acaryochloridaceae cyanobacterium CSU_5_19]|nr:hypothetical protein [Acaryochloridaceae cyanobacterium CSU_5_19]
MGMQLFRYQTAREFCDRTQAYLLNHEAEHHLLLGIQKALIRSPSDFPDHPIC